MSAQTCLFKGGFYAYTFCLAAGAVFALLSWEAIGLMHGAETKVDIPQEGMICSLY